MTQIVIKDQVNTIKLRMQSLSTAREQRALLLDQLSKIDNYIDSTHSKLEQDIASLESRVVGSTAEKSPSMLREVCSLSASNQSDVPSNSQKGGITEADTRIGKNADRRAEGVPRHIKEFFPQRLTHWQDVKHPIARFDNNGRSRGDA